MGPGGVGDVQTEAAKQAERLKEYGNTCFKLTSGPPLTPIQRLEKAIALCPNVPVYWTNGALCHRRLNDWVRVEEDCRKAIQLDHNSVKGHYMLGLALLERKAYREGAKELERALDLGTDANPRSYIVEEIWQELAKTKYLLWEHDSTERSWKLQNLKEACEKALRESHFLDDCQMEGLSDDQLSSNLRQLDHLEKVFMKAAEEDTPTEVPDYLCCKITLDIFRDPVISPSGISYERAVILEHLQKVGKFDPVTRGPLEASQLVSNLAIKDAVQAYLETHGWAYKVD